MLNVHFSLTVRRESQPFRGQCLLLPCIWKNSVFGLRDSLGSSHLASSPGIGPKEVNDLPALQSP